MSQILEHKFQRQQQQHNLLTTLFVVIVAPGLHAIIVAPTTRCHYCT
jgi:hypothetical protein